MSGATGLTGGPRALQQEEIVALIPKCETRTLLKKKTTRSIPVLFAARLWHSNELIYPVKVTSTAFSYYWNHIVQTQSNEIIFPLNPPISRYNSFFNFFFFFNQNNSIHSLKGGGGWPSQRHLPAESAVEAGERGGAVARWRRGQRHLPAESAVDVEAVLFLWAGRREPERTGENRREPATPQRHIRADVMAANNRDTTHKPIKVNCLKAVGEEGRIWRSSR